MKEKLCPNYNNILKECELDEDKISKKIVQKYKTYVEKVDINEEDARNKLVRIDKIINSYFVDFKFKKELKEKILNIKVKEDGIDLLEFLINSIIDIFDDYLVNYTRNIYIPRWI